jgi:hypothetical protein
MLRCDQEVSALLLGGEYVFKDLGQAVKGFGSPDQIMKYAKGVNFPASKQNLVSAFKNNNAPQELISVLDKLPDKNYNSPQDLISGLTSGLGGK